MTRMGASSRSANAPLRTFVHARSVERIGYPSASLPSVPSFRIEVPDGWEATPRPGCLLVVGPRDQDDDQHDGVSVRVEWLRVSAATPVRELAGAYFARTVRRHPDATVAVQKLGTLGGRPVYLRGVTMTAGDGRRVAQLQALLLVPVAAAPDVADLLVVVGTCPEGDASNWVPQFVGMAASVELDPGGVASGADERLEAPDAQMAGDRADAVDVPVDPFDVSAPAPHA
jgi:hypothetical protein